MAFFCVPMGMIYNELQGIKHLRPIGFPRHFDGTTYFCRDNEAELSKNRF
jgi:hypothetical protein